MISSSAKSERGRGLPLIVVALGLASATMLLWYCLREDDRPLVLLPGCVPSAEASPSTSRIEVPPSKEATPSTTLPLAKSVAEPAPPVPAPSSAANPKITRVEGVVVDQRTKEPVPDIVVVLRSGSVSDRVQVTDGTFRSMQEFPAGTLSAMLYDAGQNIGRAEREHREGALELGWTIDAPIGPTIPTQVSGTDMIAAAGWSARIVETLRDPASAGEIDVTPEGLRLAVDLEQHPDHEWSWLPLREGRNGDVPWIRYPTIQFPPDSTYPLRLELRHDEPALDATAVLRSTIGIHPLLVVRATASPLSARLEGEIRVDGEKSLPDVELLLLPFNFATSTTIRSNVWDTAHPQTNGHFEFPRVLPGDKVLIAFAPNHMLERTTVRLFPGRNRAPPIRLTRALQDSVELNLAAAVEAGGGKRGFGVGVQVRLVEGGTATRAWLSFASIPGNYTDWSCSLPDLPAAQFEVREIGVRVPPIWKPYRMTVLAPRDLRFESLDASDARELRFDVRVAGSARRDRGTAVSFGPGGCVFSGGGSLRDRRMLLPRDAPLEWTVWHTGCAPQFGTDADLKDGDGGRVAEVALSPGWGAQIFLRAGRPTPTTDKSPDRFDFRGLMGPGVHDLLTAPPLPMVDVIANRESVTVSDPEGAIRVSMKTMPRRLSLRCDGWHLTRLQSLAGREGMGIENYLGWMERD